MNLPRLIAPLAVLIYIFIPLVETGILPRYDYAGFYRTMTRKYGKSLGRLCGKDKNSQQFPAVEYINGIEVLIRRLGRRIAPMRNSKAAHDGAYCFIGG